MRANSAIFPLDNTAASFTSQSHLYHSDGTLLFNNYLTILRLLLLQELNKQNIAIGNLQASKFYIFSLNSPYSNAVSQNTVGGDESSFNYIFVDLSL